MSAGSNYIFLQNQGSIDKNLMLLYELVNSEGFADESGYFSKRAVAEIAVRASIISSSGKYGDEILVLVSDTETDEGYNGVLQNAKGRMELLRSLGFVSADYDSEMYTVNDMGKKMIEQAFPDSIDAAKSYDLLLEAFMRISTATEVYGYQCSSDFNNFLGFEICYALHKLDYRLSVREMCVIITYAFDEIDGFIETVKDYRSRDEQIPDTHDHYPKRKNGNPLKQITNKTRSINQILRACGILEEKAQRIDGIYYYCCTERGRSFVDDIGSRYSSLRFMTATEFRKLKLPKQKETVIDCYHGMISHSLINNARDVNTVFSPYQMLPEISVEYMLGSTIRQPPKSHQSNLDDMQRRFELSVLKVSPRFIGGSTIGLGTITGSKQELLYDIINRKTNGESLDQAVNSIMADHQSDSKDRFYPFVHALFELIGFTNAKEVGRYDCLMYHRDKPIPCEIKSYTESSTYNMKSLRQALENSILTHSKIEDLDYSSFVVGFNSPNSLNEIDAFIKSVFRLWRIKILVFDIGSLITMCIKSIWNQESVDLDHLAKSYGVVGQDNHA